MDFVRWSYTNQENQDNFGVASTSVNDDSLNAWRHKRFFHQLIPIVQCCPEASWLTVGDGRYGGDAHYLRKMGAKRVTASDINEERLAKAQQRNLIDEYSKQNVEKMTFADNSFDFVFSKETYHHLPRPPVGFYEMMRVAKKAMVLIEPIEDKARPLDRLRTTVKKLLGREEDHRFEASGNFLYRTTIREIEKMATGLNLPMYAAKELNTFFTGQRTTKWDELNRLVTRTGIRTQNALCRLRLMNYGIACVVVFKVKPSDELARELNKNGYRIVTLPQNPYVKKSVQL